MILYLIHDKLKKGILYKNIFVIKIQRPTITRNKFITAWHRFDFCCAQLKDKQNTSNNDPALSGALAFKLSIEPFLIEKNHSLVYVLFELYYIWVKLDINLAQQLLISQYHYYLYKQ